MNNISLLCKKRFFPFVLLVWLSWGCGSGNKISESNIATLNNLKTHIAYLADDNLEGRRTGTAGEKLAMEYISNQFKEIGLSPKGIEGFYQAFDVNEGKLIEEQSTTLQINDAKLKLHDDFFPLAYSANGTAKEEASISLPEAGSPWFIDLKESLQENKNSPHFDINNYILTNSDKAKARGATAIILFNTSTMPDGVSFDAKDKSPVATIPILYVTNAAAKKYLADVTATFKLDLAVTLKNKVKQGHNVVGFLDNGAAYTIIIGAHFDHLGYGEDGNSMLRDMKTPMIHNGADDNASGTAALIELARALKSSKVKNNNYLFIAFSGEELGLFGSKYFSDHPTIDLKKANYMINMDMVGRLNDSTKVITVGGYGTSPAWSSFYNSDLVSPKNNSFIFKYDSSGSGPSDHTSFYRKDIPVLFFFTGLHSDYHKPTDDADKINYSGELKIIQHIEKLIGYFDKAGKLDFAKTRETQTTTSARFSVSLGIMPDYTYAGTGVRADGVSEGKPAQKAGLQAGDVIIQLGENIINSLENYMQALGNFKKGDKTKVKYKRGNETHESEVQF